jgi:hypothetical protein
MKRRFSMIETVVQVNQMKIIYRGKEMIRALGVLYDQAYAQDTT